MGIGSFCSEVAYLMLVWNEMNPTIHNHPEILHSSSPLLSDDQIVLYYNKLESILPSGGHIGCWIGT